MSTARLVILASGSGSNLQAIIEATRRGELAGKVVSVISDHADAGALQRAATSGIKSVLCEPVVDEERSVYDERLSRLVVRAAPDLVVLAGWMRLLGDRFLTRFPGIVVNLHPALPGEYPGLRAIERAYADFTAGTGPAAAGRTGVMVHRVPDEGIDNGPVLSTVEVPITTDDTLDSLTERIHAAEHSLLIQTLQSLITTT